MASLLKNTGSQNVTFVLVNATTGAGMTGATASGFKSIDGGAQASVGGSFSELGNGQYLFAPSQADTNGTSVGYLITATGAIPVNLQFFTDNVASGALTSSERNSIADALLDRDMSTGTDSGSSTVRTVRQALRFLRNKWAIAAGSLTVYKEDDATSSWTSSVTTDASALPIVTNDPAGP